jgi:hypothetical protein
MSSIPYIREGSSNVRMPKDYGYVYAQVNDWASLEDLVDPKEGDIAYIQDLPTGGGGGLGMVLGGEAIYTGGSWKLRRAQGLTKAALDAYLDSGEYGYEAIVGCIGVVRVTPYADASSKYYYWTGSEWLRTPDGTGYIHPSVPNWDTLPSDNVQDEDQVFVNSLDDVETSNGIAKWSESDEEWKLQEVTYSGWNPYTFSTAFAGTITNGAIIRTDDGSWEAPLYFWNTVGSDWIRSPENVNYLWPQTIPGTWASLNTDGKLNADRISVPNWTTGGSDGVAQYDGSEWKLVEGVVDTIANLLAFTGEKEPGAKVTVGTGIAADPVYFWSGTGWLRTADQSHYIWPQVNNWSELTTLRPHAINNDEVPVHTLNVSQSSGTAQLHGGTWKLIEGKWPSVTDMNDWDEGDIHSGAIAYVDPTHQYDQDSTVYYYTGGAWVATQPAGVTKVHTISSIYDFSASGLADGDYGVLTPSGGSPIVLRYKAACTIAAGGTRAVWMTPTAYAGSPVLQAWTDGTENNSTLASQGWTLAIGTGCTLGPTGGYQRMATPGSQVSVSLAAMSGAITSTTKVESIYECRGSIPGGSTVRSKQFYLADGVNGYSIGDSGAGGSNGYGYRQAATGAIVNTPIRDVTSARIPALAATPFVCVARDEGRTVFASLSVNGNAFADYRRNLGSIAASIFYVYITGDITAPITMDYRGQVLTY